jgi:hypothetical protein
MQRIEHAYQSLNGYAGSGRIFALTSRESLNRAAKFGALGIAVLIC